jgi:hypothetical protein
MLTPLERKVMEMMLAGEHPVLDVLRSQLNASHVLERTYDSVGFFTKFYVPSDAPRIKAKRLVISDVCGEIPYYYPEGHAWVCDFLLFVEDGAIDTLEAATPDDEWTEDESRIVVKYVHSGKARLLTQENQRDWRRLFRDFDEAG